MMKLLSYLAFAFLLSIPLAAAIDLEPRPELPTGAGGLENERWEAPIAEESGSSWWERTVFDQNRNGLADQLESYAELSGHNAVPAYVAISYDRHIEDSDIEELTGRGFPVSSVMEDLDAVTILNFPSNRIYELLSLPGVVFVEPLGAPVLYSDIATPTVKAKQSSMFSPYTAWEEGYQGRGVNIAVIDTGIDDEHPALQGKFVAGVDMTKPEIPAILFPRDGTYNPDDIQGHGSTCSGIATGTGAPEGKYQGTAPEARLVDVRIGTKIGYAPGEFWAGAQNDPHILDGTINGIEWATDNLDTPWGSGGEDNAGIDVFSISWGVDVGQPSDGTDLYSRALNTAVEKGAIVVNAAGNDGPENNGFTGLSASSEAIIVAATVDKDTLEQEDDVVAWYSSRGPRHDDGDGNPYNELKPDIAAPGTNITQLQPDTTRLTGDASNNGYGNRGSGTSYATPLVAGVVALILEANPELEDRNEIVKEVLKYTADRMKPPMYPELDPFWEKDFGYGTVDAYAAVILSANIPNMDNVDPRLQAHITNVSFSFTDDNNHTWNKPYYSMYEAVKPVKVSGLGWSKGGEFEKVQYKLVKGGIDIGPGEAEWKDAEMDPEQPFNPWTIDLGSPAIGTYTLWVRSVGGGRESLYSFLQFDADIEVEEPGFGAGGGFLLPLLLFLGAALGAGIFIYYKMRSRSSSQG
ncbi:MAG: S8 family peptidase [Thermoplasmatota archaeon]